VPLQGSIQGSIPCRSTLFNMNDFEFMMALYLKCEDCEEVREDVKETLCPFVQEIHDEDVPATLCEDCYHERCMDT
jgi:hypothetical protein